MKIFKITLSSFLALTLIACTGIFLFFQTFDTDQYLSKITKRVSASFGRPVTIGHVGLGLSSRGITLDAWPLTIADDPDFTSQSFITIDRARISLDLVPLIFRRDIRITGILLQSPRVHLIRSQNGQFNFRSFDRPVQADGDNSAAHNVIGSDRTGPSLPPQPSLSAMPAATSKPLFSGISVHLVQIQDGAISYIDQKGAMDIWLKDINVKLKDFSLTKPFPVIFAACFYCPVPNIHVSAKVSIDPVKKTLEINGLKTVADLSRLDINEIKGISPDDEKRGFIENSRGIVNLDLVRLHYAHSGGLEANGSLSITGGVIKNFNIIKILFSHTLGVFGGMQGNIENLFKGQLGRKLGADDTIIEKAQTQFSYKGKILSIDDSLVQTDIFELTAQGTIDKGLNVDMQTMLHLNSDASSLLTNEFKGLGFLCDASNRITITASLKGVIPHLKYKPNKEFRKKSRKALMQEGANILGVLLGGGQTSAQEEVPVQDQPKRSKDKLKGIFKGIF